MEWLSLCVQRTILRDGQSPLESQHTLLRQWNAENPTPRTTQHFELVAVTASVLWGYLDEALGVHTLLENVRDSPFPCGSVCRQWATHLHTRPNLCCPCCTSRDEHTFENHVWDGAV